jgi:hypothetical protein
MATVNTLVAQGKVGTLRVRPLTRAIRAALGIRQ